MKRVMIATAVAAAQLVAAPSRAAVFERAPTRIAVATPAGSPCSAYAGHLERLDDASSRYAIALFTHDGTHRVTGVVALYHGDDRYDVRVANVTAADWRDRGAMPTPVVVRLDVPVRIEAAVVTSLDGHPCAPMTEPIRPGAPVTLRIGTTRVGARPHQPLNAPPSDLDDAFWQRFRTAASSAPAAAPDGVAHETHISCAHPDQGPNTLFVASSYGVLDADAMARGAGGQAWVLVTLDDANAVVRSRIERPSGSSDVDRDSLAIVNASQFRSPIFHCRAYGGSYLFGTDLR